MELYGHTLPDGPLGFRSASHWTRVRFHERYEPTAPLAERELSPPQVAALNKAGKVPLFSASGSYSGASNASCPNNVGEWPEEDYLGRIRAQVSRRRGR